MDALTSNKVETSSSRRHIELTKRTNELLSDYSDFLQLNGPVIASKDPTFTQDESHCMDVRARVRGPLDEINLWDRQTARQEVYSHDYDADRKKLYRYHFLRGNAPRYCCILGITIVLIISAVTFTRKDEAESPVVDQSYTPSDPALQQLYTAVSSLFHPKWYDRQSGWEGQAYLQSYQFCNSQQGGMEPCSYTAYCPGGVGGVPFGGVRGDGLAWAPVKNSPNEWVQVGDSEGEMCQLYSTMHGGSTPFWGLQGEHNEKLTRNVLCCVVLEEDGMMDGVPPDSSLPTEVLGSDTIDRPPLLDADHIYGQSISSSALPDGENGDSVPATSSGSSSEEPYKSAHWFSRLDGWEGTTYEEALAFCFSQNGKLICPYEAYCPKGPGNPPHDTTSIKDLIQIGDESWSPVWVNDGEAWTGVGSVNQCVPPAIKPQLPPERERDFTSFLLCCDFEDLDPENSVVGPSTGFAETAEGTDNSQTQSQQTALEGQDTSGEPTDEEFIQAAKDGWNPIWYSLSDQSALSWDGSTYAAANIFCEKSIPGGRLCPYPAICPNGAGSSPYPYGFPDITSEQWIPTDNGPYSWILVGRSIESEEGKGGEICGNFESFYGEKPQFGLDGTQKEKKKYMLCCHSDPNEEGRRVL